MNARSGRKWLKRIALALVLLLVIAAGVPFFVPLERYLPTIEQQASAALGAPVTITGIRLLALPQPHITLTGINVGNSIKADKLTLTPELFSLLQQTKVIRRIDVDGLALKQQAFRQLAALGSPPAPDQKAPQLSIGSIHLHGARLDIGRTQLGPYDALINLDHDGKPLNAALTSQDGKLKLRAKSTGSQYIVEARAKSWTLPTNPALMFDTLSIKGTATPTDAVFEDIRASLYGGALSGRATVDWQQGLRLRGNLVVSHLELRQISAMLSPGTRISGKLNARPTFSAVAPSPALLAEAMRVESQFDIQDGVLQGMDIEKAASSANKQGSSGGETRFQQLTGHLLMEHRGYHFTELNIASGSIAVDGNVDISPQQALSGRINAKLKIGTSIPLNVGGTVDKPLLYPTGGTMTGAAIGTVILGPGLGTSLGAKVGGWAEKLLGGKKTDKSSK